MADSRPRSIAGLSRSEKEKLLLRLLSEKNRKRPPEERTSLTERAILDDAVLDPRIQAIGKAKTIREPRVILLTGATGFLGAHLLSDLCRLTEARIYCLLRDDSVQTARSRLDTNFRKYFDRPPDEKRVIPVVGDLSKPALGLRRERLEELAGEVDTVWHCGAHVSHLLDYGSLKAINVSSTIEILKLATSRRPKVVHFISSLIAAVEQDAEGRLVEDVPGGLPPAMPGGYALTKWVSERILAQAMERGVPVRIYRPGILCGQRVRGVWPFEKDHLLHALKGCVQMGFAPRTQLSLDMLPVDFASEALVRMSLLAQGDNAVFNLSNPHAATWVELIQWANLDRQNLTLVPEDEWREKHLRHIRPDNALYSMLPLYLAPEARQQQERIVSRLERVEIRNAASALAACGLTFPKVDRDLWTTYFDYLRGEGHLPG